MCVRMIKVSKLLAYAVLTFAISCNSALAGFCQFLALSFEVSLHIMALYPLGFCSSTFGDDKPPVSSCYDYLY